MTVPVDPGTGLQDGVDFVLLAGISGLHARFAQLYNTLDPGQVGIMADNMDLTDDYDFQGGLLQNSQEILRVLSTTTGIDGKVATTTNLYTVPAGKTAVIVGVSLRLTTVASLSGTLTAGVGIAAGEDDIFPATSLIGFNDANECYLFTGPGVRKAATAGQIIKLGIDVAFGGTTVTLEAQVLGYHR